MLQVMCVMLNNSKITQLTQVKQLQMYDKLTWPKFRFVKLHDIHILQSLLQKFTKPSLILQCQCQRNARLAARLVKVIPIPASACQVPGDAQHKRDCKLHQQKNT